MGKVYRALAVAALALGLLFPTHQTLADDAADVEAVERELEAEETALQLYRRAVERASKAVEASSLGQKVKRLWGEFWAAREAFEETRAYREYLGPDKLEIVCITCSREEQKARSAEIETRRERYQETHLSFRIAEIVEERDAAHRRMNLLRNRMVLKFLANEIARVAEQELGDLERELRELEKKARKGVTI